MSYTMDIVKELIALRDKRATLVEKNMYKWAEIDKELKILCSSIRIDPSLAVEIIDRARDTIREDK